MASNWYPNLDPKADPATREAFRRTLDMVHELRGRLETIEATKPVGLAQATEMFGPAATKKNLEAGGSHPLSVQNLLGVSVEAQSVVGFLQGAGSPEGLVTANPGAFFFRTDGAPGTTVYTKATGQGTTGWVAKL